MTKKSWKKVLVSPETSILKTIEVIDAGAMQIAFVVDKNDLLVGTVTDGDVRRGILKAIPLNNAVTAVMNTKPITAKRSDGREQVLEAMKSQGLRHIPVLDNHNRLVSVEVLEDLLDPKPCDNWVVLMAGGQGTRLRPLTENTPKPLLSVGNKPLLETTLSNFIDQGFRNFYLSVNYKAEMIREHFGDGSRWNVNIQYLQESKELGTAGALSLLPAAPSSPLIVMNGDLLTKVNFKNLIDFHQERKAQATMCVREYDFQVPYGVVRMDDDVIAGIDEKPIQRFFVNAGIYVLDADVLRLIPADERLDMTSLFEKLIAERAPTAAFPVREYWLDIGRMDDFVRANGEFAGIFDSAKKK